MQCPTCGKDLQGNTVCMYCGESFEEKRGITRNQCIAVILLAVMALSLFYSVRYETDKADKLVRAAEIEMERGRTHLQQAKSTLLSFKDIQIEAVDHTNAELTYVLHAKEMAQRTLFTLEEASLSFERAETFLNNSENLRLSARYRQYCACTLQTVKECQTLCRTLHALAAAFTQYYGFAAHYLAGEVALLELMSDLDRGNDNLERGDLTFAFSAYESAVFHLKEAQHAYSTASDLIDLSYVTDSLTNLTHLERALDNLTEAARQLQLGNDAHAQILAALGVAEIESVVLVGRLQLKHQMTQWYQEHITAVIYEVEQIEAEIEALKQKTETLTP